MVASDGPSDRPLREISMQTTGDAGVTAITGVFLITHSSFGNH